MNIPGYDAWKLDCPDATDAIGTEEGDVCNRCPEPDGDEPRGWRPKPCDGVMIEQDGETVCDTCGEVG